MKLDLSKIPEYMHEGIQEYVDHGRPTGSFLRAIFCNNLVDAAATADINNKTCLFAYASLLYNEIPRAAWGDEKSVDRWIKVGGMDHYMKAGE